jgi:hypothetical protein
MHLASSSISESSAGKDAAKMTPVSSRCSCRSLRLAGASPSSSVRAAMSPALSSARRPAATASAYVVSSVSATFGSMPNSLIRSNSPMHDATLITSCTVCSGRRCRVPSGPLTTCTMLLSSCACSAAAGSGPIRLSPRMMLSRFSSLKTARPLTAFGSPTETPVTWMSPRCSPSARTRSTTAKADATMSAAGASPPCSLLAEGP